MNQQLSVKVKKFEKWLSERGATVLKPTSQWELVRFKCGNETSVIYTNKLGKLSFTGSSQVALDNFKVNGSWRAAKAATRRKKSISPIVKTLLDRDGDLCFFCMSNLGGDVTVEHLLSITHGGSNHISNMVLSHRLCNQKAGHLSLMEKINFHVNSRLTNPDKDKQ